MAGSEKFTISTGQLSPLATSLASECVTAFDKSKSGAECGQKVALAVQKYVEAAIAIIEKDVESAGFQKAVVQDGTGTP